MTAVFQHTICKMQESEAVVWVSFVELCMETVLTGCGALASPGRRIPQQTGWGSHKNVWKDKEVVSEQHASGFIGLVYCEILILFITLST